MNFLPSRNVTLMRDPRPNRWPSELRLLQFKELEPQAPSHPQTRRNLMRRMLSLLLIFALAAPLLAVAAQAETKPSLEARRKQVNDLLAEQWEYTLQTSPEFATILGDKRFNDRLSDFS